MNFSTKQTHRLREWIYGCWKKGWEEGIVREFGMDMYILLYLKWITKKSYCIAQGTLLNVMWQPGWEESLGENGYMYMYGWVSLLSTWNYHDIVNWLYSKIRYFKIFIFEENNVKNEKKGGDNTYSVFFLQRDFKMFGVFES